MVDREGRNSDAIAQPIKHPLVSKYAKQHLPIHEGDAKEEDEQMGEPFVVGTDTISEPDYVNVDRLPSPEEDRNNEDNTTNEDAAELTRQETNDFEQTPAKEEAEPEAHEELNREIALRNETIRKLRREIGFLQTAHEREVAKTEAASSEQMKALRLELDSVRETLVDLDDKHRSTVESHKEILRSKNEEIEKISSDALELQWKLRAADKAKDNRGDKDDELNRFEEEELQRLSQVNEELEEKLRAANEAKEEYENEKSELIRSKDEAIQSLLRSTQEVEGKMKARKNRRLVTPMIGFVQRTQRLTDCRIPRRIFKRSLMIWK